MKRLLILLLALSLLLCACGSGSNTETTGNTVATTETTTEATTEMTTEPAGTAPGQNIPDGIDPDNNTAPSGATDGRARMPRGMAK